MKREISDDRRAFIKKAAILGGFVAFFGGLKQAKAAPKQPPPAVPVSNGQGYRLTEHVKKYYETARL